MKIKEENDQRWRNIIMDEMDNHVEYDNEDLFLALVRMEPMYTGEDRERIRADRERTSQSLKAALTSVHQQIDEAYHEECAMNGEAVTICGLGTFYSSKIYGEDRALTYHLRGEMPISADDICEGWNVAELITNASDVSLDSRETYLAIIHWPTFAKDDYQVQVVNIDDALKNALLR